jgi:hypothetical protein
MKLSTLWLPTRNEPIKLKQPSPHSNKQGGAKMKSCRGARRDAIKLLAEPILGTLALTPVL